MEGQGILEYALILILVAVVVISVLMVVGPAVGNVFSLVVARLTYGGETLPTEPPPECYGSLLLPIMIAVMGSGVGVSYLLPRRPAESPCLVTGD